VPFFNEERPVIPLPEYVVEPVTLTVSVVLTEVVRDRAVSVKLEDPTETTTPLTCGGAKPVGEPPLADGKVVVVDSEPDAAAGELFDERFAAIRPATTPTATTTIATINQVVRRVPPTPGGDSTLIALLSLVRYLQLGPSFQRSL
jgi:hypothetical protein